MSLCGSLNVFVWVIVCISLCLHFVVAVCLWMSFACLCVFAVIMRVITCVWLCICAFVFVNVCMLYVCLRVLFVNLCMSFVRVCKYAMMFVCIYMLWFFNGVCVAVVEVFDSCLRTLFLKGFLVTGDCPNGWMSQLDGCYLLQPTAVEQAAAATLCNRYNATLACIASQEEYVSRSVSFVIMFWPVSLLVCPLIFCWWASHCKS